MKISLRQRVMAMFLVLIMMVSLVPSLSFATENAREIIIMIDGVRMDFGSGPKPFLDANGRTQVPFKAVLEAYGADVSWNEYNGKKYAIAQLGTKRASVIIGTNLINYGDIRDDKTYVTKQMDTKPILKNGSTYLPIKPVIDALGGKLEWNNTLKAVNLIGGTGEFTAYVSNDSVAGFALDNKSVEEKIRIVSDKTLFAVYAFINATGYDSENHTTMYPIRKQLRDEIKSMNLQLTEPNYYKEKGIQPFEYTYSMTHSNGSYPYVVTPHLGLQMQSIPNFVERLNEFYAKADIDKLYEKYNVLIQKEIKDVFEPQGREAINTTLKMYSLDINKVSRDIEFRVNLLESNWKAANMNVSGQPQFYTQGTPDIISVAGSPNNDSVKSNFSHELLHSFTIPVTNKSTNVSKLIGYLENQKLITAGGYGNWMQNIDESFVRAMSIRAVYETSKQRDSVKQEVRDGFLMTEFIYDRLSTYNTKYKGDIEFFINEVTKEFYEDIAGGSIADSKYFNSAAANETGWVAGDVKITSIVKFNDETRKNDEVVFVETLESYGAKFQVNVHFPWQTAEIYTKDITYANPKLHGNMPEDGSIRYTLTNNDTGVEYICFTWVGGTLIARGDNYDFLTMESQKILPRGNYTFRINTLPTPYGELNAKYEWKIIMK